MEKEGEGQWPGLVGHKFGHSFRHARDLFRTQLRKHRQGKNFLRGVFRMREVAGFMPKRSVERLQVQGNRIINRTSDFSLVQKLHKRIAPLHANRILVKDVFVSFRDERRRNAGNAQQEF